MSKKVTVDLAEAASEMAAITSKVYTKQRASQICDKYIFQLDQVSKTSFMHYSAADVADYVKAIQLEIDML